ncbi:MAG: RNA 2',3'-cyclic phosphodiesterase [Anaerolineales bacterium]|nr:RNA 2',3'-cyclic phosphodiesterase [Anaerolineales bacterium]
MTDVRTFIAIILPEIMLRSLNEQIDLVKEQVPSGAIRWVRPETIHLTLKFLGNVAPTRLSAVKASTEEVATGHSPFAFAVSSFGCFPNFRRPRTLWLGVQDPLNRLSSIHFDLEEAFSRLGFSKEGRAFHPHLTLGRVKRHVRGEVARTLSEGLEQVKIGDLGRVEAREICVMRSDLLPSGAVHTQLFSAPLKGTA